VFIPKKQKRQTILPFCRDVLNIIVEYLPFVTRETFSQCIYKVYPVVALSSEVVAAFCSSVHGERLCVHKMDENGKKPRLLARLSLNWLISMMATCVYPCTGTTTVSTQFLVASSSEGALNMCKFS